jgi:diguanylate cyclase (GGDEF)-like protein
MPPQAYKGDAVGQSGGVLASSKKLSLSLVLIVPFVLQVVLATGSVGYLAFRNGQRAVEEMASQLMDEVSKRVEQRLKTYLATPQLVNQLNADAVTRGELTFDFSQPNRQAEQLIWQQMRLFPHLKWILLGVEQNGSHLGIWRADRDQGLQLAIANSSTQSLLVYHETDATGQRGKPLKVEGPKYDPRQRPWYKAAIAQQKPTWTTIYPGFTPGTVFIAASQPIYSPTRKLLGVSAVDVSLLDIQKFLAQAQVSASGQIFIIERSGLLVASSSQEPIFRPVPSRQPQRLNIRDSKIPLVQAIAEYSNQYPSSFSTIRQKLRFQFDFNQQQHFAQVLPFSDSNGLDWLIVIVVPASDFKEQIHGSTQTTILLCFAALGLAIGVGTLTSRWIVRPILSLSTASQKIAQGDFSQQVALAGTQELAVLAESFNQMSQEILQSRQQLEDYSRSLEQKVSDRTQALQLEVGNRIAAETALQAVNKELERIAYLDGLTQMANRRRFDQCLEQEWRRMKREQQPLSLILCDVDYFKQYNDLYGHQVGDECLRTVARVIHAATKRPADLAARYGGEEFAVILPNTTLQGAFRVAEEVQARIRQLKLPHQSSLVNPCVTLSFGVASIVPAETDAPDQLITSADRVLYQAKITGRDRIVLHQ